MANPIIVPKKSTVAGKIPTTSDLASGEIAINHADKKLYAKDPTTGNVQEIGSLSAHSHDQLISIDSTADLELQNNGSVIITDGAVSTTLALSSTTARTITFPDKTGTVALLDDVGGGGGVTVSSTAPASPSEGDLWLDSDTFELFVYYDNAWVELGQPSREARSEWASPYHYLGFSTYGTSESATSWTITRTTISDSGEITAEQSATGAWSNRTSLSYS